MTLALVALATVSVGCSSDLTSDTATTTTTVPDDLRAYYAGIGVDDTAIDCIVDALAEIGVVRTSQLEGDEQVTVVAAQRIDVCLAKTSVISP